MRHARDLLNCWLVAMWIWSMGRSKYPVAVRRSHSFWFVPHFIATMPSKWRHFLSVEFVPVKGERWTTRDFVLLFRGRYRVVEFRAQRVVYFDSYAELAAWLKWQAPD